jgi:hypothetical protein
MSSRHIARSRIKPSDSRKSPLELCQPIAWVHGDGSIDRFADNRGNRHLTPARLGA